MPPGAAFYSLNFLPVRLSRDPIPVPPEELFPVAGRVRTRRDGAAKQEGEFTLDGMACWKQDNGTGRRGR